MDLPTFAQLLTPRGQAALAAAMALAPTEQDFLAQLQRLQKNYPAALARAALETVLNRARARGKFDRAEAMYFTREALEQATGERVARYRAERLAGFERVVDLGCGIGGDSLGLAARSRVVAVDRDSLRLAMARENLAVYGLRQQADFVRADLNALPWRGAQAFFFDPARRSASRRRFSVRDYEPPLALALEWLKHTPAGGVKVSPGVDLDELAAYAAEIEFISERGALKEAVLWLGPLKTAERRATLLPGPHTLLADPQARIVLGQPAAYLYEPDPAVLRAGLVTTLAAQLGAHQLDPDIAYLAASDLRPTAFARAFAIESAMPFQLKRLRQHLRALRVGHVTVKKRGSPLEPDALIKQLRLAPGAPESRFVLLTHVAGEPWVLVGKRVISS